MIEMLIEIYPDVKRHEIHVIRCAPKFGKPHDAPKGGKQYGTLCNGTHRVKFAVFNAMLTLPAIKALARMAITSEVQSVWDKPQTLSL